MFNVFTFREGSTQHGCLFAVAPVCPKTEIAHGVSLPTSLLSPIRTYFVATSIPGDLLVGVALQGSGEAFLSWEFSGIMHWKC